MSLNTVPTNYHEFEYAKFFLFKLKFMNTGRIHAERCYIEHARVAEVTGELLPAQPGLLPGLVVVVVVVAPRRLTMSARHATPSSRPPHGSARRARVITA